MKINDLIYMVSQMDDLQKEELLLRLNLSLDVQKAVFRLSDSGSYTQISNNRNFPAFGNLVEVDNGGWNFVIDYMQGYVISGVRVGTMLTHEGIFTDYTVGSEYTTTETGDNTVVHIESPTFGQCEVIVEITKK